MGRVIRAWEVGSREPASPHRYVRMWALAGAEGGIGSTHASVPHHTKLDADPPGSARASVCVSTQLWVPGAAWHFTSCRKQLYLPT